MSKVDLPVFIVGAGPTGLTLAFWLRKKGIAVRIIDKSSGPGTTTRALGVQARTLEFYQQLGIAEKVIAKGITAKEIRFRRNGKVVANIRLGAMGADLSPFSYLLFCSQDEHEKILIAELEKMGTKVERETELVGFSQDAQSVTLRIKGPRGDETAAAKYLCGCDGASSAVRHGLNLSFGGGDYQQIFFVADVLTDEDVAQDGLQISVSAKDFCIIMPIHAQGTIRLTGIVPPAAEKKQIIDFQDVAESVKRNTGLNVRKVNWFSAYHVHHRVAERFHQGRVFLAGDAGHIHSPAGGQGMNTGIGDAFNLAWKIAAVLNGEASENIIATYEVERLAFAKVLVSTTDTAFKFIASRTLAGSIFRPYVIPIFLAGLSRSEKALKFIFKVISQIRIKYPNSALSWGSVGDVNAGDRLPWVKVADGDNFAALQSLNWQIHIYGEVRSDLNEFAKSTGLKLCVFKWEDNFSKKSLKENAMYLIRPDGYIGFLQADQSVEKLRDYMQEFNLRMK